MRKLMKKICCAALLLACGCLASCNGGNTTSVSDEKSIDIDTTHINESEELDACIYRGNTYSYSLILSASPSDNETKAASALRRFFYEATRKTIDFISEGTPTGNHGIYIGNTEKSDENGVAYDYDSNSGFIIKTVNEDIYLKGGNSGIIYAAYELLTDLFNFDYYDEYDYEIDTDVTEIKLKDYNIVEIPDIEYRSSFVSGAARSSSDSMYSQCMRTVSNRMTGMNLSSSHNSFLYVPYYATDEEAMEALGEYYTPHYRDWFANVSDPYNPSIPCNLCYSRYQDEFYRIAVKNMKETIAKYPDYDFYNFSNNDNLLVCTCDECKKQPNQSYQYVRFLNRMAKECHEWAETELHRDIKIIGLAYYGFETAPVTITKDGSELHAEPYDDSVVFDDNLFMQFAIHMTDYQIPFNAVGNEKDFRNLVGWSALCSHLFTWTYSQAEFSNYLMFYDNFSSLQQNIQLQVKYNTYEILDQGQHDQGAATAFNNLRAYVTYKLQWNSKLDYQSLVRKYFNHVFGPASEAMRSMFDSLINRYTLLHSQDILSQNTSDYFTKEIFPRGFVNSMMAKLDEAYAGIEGNAEYDYYYENILLESIFVRVTQIEVYSSDYTSAELTAMKRQLKKDMTELGITKKGESRPIETLFEEWGV